MIEQLVKNQRDAIKDDAYVVAPPPTLRRIHDKGARNDGSKDGKGQRRHEDEGDNGPALLIGHELTENDAK